MVENAMETASQINLLDTSRYSDLSDPIDASNHGAVAKLLTLAENGDDKLFKSKLEEFILNPPDADVGT